MEKHYSIRQAAKIVGVDRETLRRWLGEVLAVPRVKHGAKILVRESDLERVVAKRRDARAA